MAEVKLVNVQKAYGEAVVLKDINLQVRDGEFMVFVGPSGCGKSTLLRSIAGLEDITGGELSIGGRVVNDVPPAERGVAMVFQSYALYPHMDLYENMAFGLKLAKVPKDEIDRAVHSAAKILNIDHLLHRKPKDLSGGQRQRVAIGRAIVRKPEVFLFDEPLSNLDTALRVKMRYEFAKLHEDLKTTMIYVTHDQVEAMTLADRIVVLSAGKIEQVGSPLALYEHPDNLFVAGFIGSPAMNFLPGTIVSASGADAVVRLGTGETVRCEVDAARAQVGDAVTLGIRPEHFVVGHADNRLQAQVTFVEQLGSATFAYGSLPGTEVTLTCELDGALRLKSGEPLMLGVPAGACHLFDAQGLAFRRHAAQDLRQAA
ncbi:sn-glycerol-3-phosphate ABC transporter ATP-binding protein UgpC [Ideonella sp. 4Y16]|uniref:Sn-glycerol-3-phosphate ABC transporter ATP-binding protein UgpC n=1 Tax=Ideonella alba TaxID=2824118 RepID=A0A940YG24_9BURK|nr:sn-glycerol-3-phosphate ABC transporter ATP-binding protein UgpC [Ideonella alba]MBQ0931835.1 sn-glycerol-3-phosphate ABC transporter ATP-binding protein UgpC [Ideonella alba]MBQ0941721.1 sn-glycerol-3-phosphate ABC transporter ATP-binding protein UgpC [Ideonella alba]